MNEFYLSQVVDSSETKLRDAYDMYRACRFDLHQAEMKDDVFKGALLDVTLEAKDVVAGAAKKLYEEKADRTRFIESVAINLYPECEHDTVSTEDILIPGYITPLSLEKDVPSAVESIMATAENLEIAKEFSEVGSKTLDGMLMSGTTSWGEFYAVSGGVHPTLKALGADPTSKRKHSDIDILAMAPSIDYFEQTIKDYVAAGMLDESELLRFTKFQHLYDINEADIFSVRSNYKGVEQSLHFIPEDIVIEITNLDTLRLGFTKEHQISVLNDFRPNIPRNTLRYGGYQLDDIKGLKQQLFKPIITEVHGPKSASLGYVSENPIGGQFKYRGQETYALGVLPFFLAINPTLLINKDNKLSGYVNNFQQNLASILGDKPLAKIPAQDRMSRRVLSQIQDSLTLH